MQATEDQKSMDFSKDERGEEKARVLICDDHDLIRRALRTVINSEPDMQIVGEAPDGGQAVALARELRPDAVVMDIEMPELSGIEATRAIKELLPGATILVLTVHDDYEYILGVLEAGATGYLTKGIISNEIPSAIRGAMSGESILSDEILKKLLTYARQSRATDSPFPAVPDLTERELELLRLTAKGYSNKIISRELGLTENTVKKYMMSVFTKLGVRSRTAAVIRAQQIGLLSTDPESFERRAD